MAKCSRCENDKTVYNSYCLSCKAAFMREWRHRNPMNPEQKRKDSCRSYAGVYKRRGKLIPSACADCGSAKAEMHHEDYSQPLKVKWLCRKCHLLRHKMS